MHKCIVQYYMSASSQVEFARLLVLLFKMYVHCNHCRERKEGYRGDGINSLSITLAQPGDLCGEIIQRSTHPVVSWVVPR